jgi:hypothetical protein
MQARVIERLVPGMMMIGVENLRAGREQTLEIRTVLLHGNVQHRDAITIGTRDLAEQVYVSLDPSHQYSVTGFSKPQLDERANSVGIAIENIVIGHGQGFLEKQ